MKILQPHELPTREEIGALPEEDTNTILDMADFYGITTGEAYQRFINGNHEGIIIDDEEEEEIE